MTFVLAHGALGVWDEVGAVVLLVGGIAAGLAFAVFGPTNGDGGPERLEEQPGLTGRPLVKSRDLTRAKPDPV